MAAYAHAGVPHYWVVAPDSGSLTVYGLGDGDTYAEEHHVESRQELALTKPLEVTLRPELLTLHP